MNQPMTLDPRVRERIGMIHGHIAMMEHERRGWGPDVARDVADTRESFLDALRLMLVESTEVWIDGGTGWSFGGTMGGITYGVIARQKVAHMPDGAYFTYAPIEWTFHS